MSDPRPLRDAFFAFAALGGLSALIYLVAWLADFGVAGPTPIALMTESGVRDTLLSFSEVTVAVLGIAITVVAIIVELAANRYTPRITELFVGDMINRAVLGFYVVTAAVVLWVNLSLHGESFPQVMSLVSVGLMSASLLSLLPYFVYVFDFLGPTRVVARMESQSVEALHSVASKGVPIIALARQQLLSGVEQLGDITLNSVDKRDKPIAIATIGALAMVAKTSIDAKSLCPEPWFDSEILVKEDQDFVAFHPNIVRALTSRHTWVEMKVYRQYQAAFGASTHRLRDVCHLIAIETRQIAYHARVHGDLHGYRLSIRFLNTYMRAAINSKDVRTAYNLLNEYRFLAEQLLVEGHTEEVVDLANHMRFYGQLSFARSLAFILESAGYDLCTLLERAYLIQAPAHDELLDIFLEVDREPDASSAQESALRGVRKAQIKLATFYLSRQAVEPAKRIFQDMQHERPERLNSIREELESVLEEEFWEVSDRGINFEWLGPDRRPFLATFYDWFEHV